MRAGTENRNKTIAAGVLGTGALIAIVYLISQFFGDSTPTPPPSITANTTTAQPRLGGALQQNSSAINDGSTASGGNAAGRPASGPGVIAGVDAKRLASTSASLDPTLDQRAMLRAEHLVYSGSGRNIFSANYVPSVKATVVPTTKYPARPAVTQTYVPPQPPPTCPPSCPPINLKFFGTATRGAVRQAFLLQGDEVFLASVGDIVARKYKIVSISPNSLQVEDLGNSNTQTLPLQAN